MHIQICESSFLVFVFRYKEHCSKNIRLVSRAMFDCQATTKRRILGRIARLGASGSELSIATANLKRSTGEVGISLPIGHDTFAGSIGFAGDVFSKGFAGDDSKVVYIYPSP